MILRKQKMLSYFLTFMKVNETIYEIPNDEIFSEMCLRPVTTTTAGPPTTSTSSGSSGRKKRSATTPWEEVNKELINTRLMERVEQRNHVMKHISELMETEEELMQTVEQRKLVKRQAPEAVETEEEVERRSYGSVLRYECGPARKFYDPEWEELYDERYMQCNWNNSWTKVDYVDECVWVQCMYPPAPPPETLLADTWNMEPVEFYDNVSYICPGDDLFFEWDRDIEVFNISCLPGGSWDEPAIWPNCVPCKFL